MKAEDIEFEQTCPACPESYKLIYDGEEVGYLRLRWGYVSVTSGKYVSIFANDRDECIDVWDYKFEGDDWKGMFDSYEERAYFLNEAAIAVCKYYN